MVSDSIHIILPKQKIFVIIEIDNEKKELKNEN